ncbi:hypothetical protein HYR69_02895, partial [Candidatus Sumerlaeota bacterium]|nr:hypothetical protein [Candidatus Sumerlaeota bacterium]
MTAPAVSVATPDPRRQLTLEKILGHAEILGYCKRSIREEQFPQSILISGPQGVGKRTLA